VYLPQKIKNPFRQYYDLTNGRFMMLDNLAASDNEIRKTFAEKAKNMVGLIGQNLQNHSGHFSFISSPEKEHCRR